MIKNVFLVLIKSALYFCSILMELEIYRQIFEKFSIIKFHENLSNGSRVVSCGITHGQTGRQADRHEEAGGRFTEFCERT
jgi:hypothetical protein